MGAWFESLQKPRLGGEPMKPKVYQLYIIRTVVVLVFATLVALALLSWTQPFELQTVALRWEKSRSISFLSSRNETRKNETYSTKVAEEEGVGLLHSWKDAELFVRALSMDISTSGLKNNSASPKIAFMFLIQKDLPFAPLWNKFFEGHEGLYNIYVHMWPLRLDAIPKTMGVFWGRVIPSEEGRRQTPGLIADARRLLANALLDDPYNEWFAMVSESCIPLHGFRHIYDTVANTSKTFMEVNHNHWDMWNRYLARGDDVMKPEVEYWQFRVGSQFWIMRRRHALLTIGDTKYWDKFNRPCLPKYFNCYPEEHYFATLLNILDAGGTTTYSVTLVDWSHAEAAGHPKRFQPSEINRKLIKGFQDLKDGRFLFARKFERGCLQPLLNISDAILEH